MSAARGELVFAGMAGISHHGTVLGGSVADLADVAASGQAQQVRFDPGRADHILRDAPGHVNPASTGSHSRFARLFEDVASVRTNLRADAVRAGILAQDAANAGVQAFTWVRRRG